MCGKFGLIRQVHNQPRGISLTHILLFNILKLGKVRTLYNYSIVLCPPNKKNIYTRVCLLY